MSLKPTGAYPVEIDFKTRAIDVGQSYSFKENAEQSSVTATRTITLSFDDFTDIYERFVQLRMIPKSDCDILEPSNYQTLVDEQSGMIFANFFLAYDDKFCFPLRFYNPVTDPGVHKDPTSYQGSRDGFAVHNAFQPKVREGLLWVDMASSFEGDGARVVKKLAESPLEGFLQDPAFFDFMQAIILTGKFEQWDKGKSMKITDAKFTHNKTNAKTELVARTQTTMPSQTACDLHKSHLNSGKWR